MATSDYVTPAELDVALNELDKKLESRLYTIRGDLLGRMDRMEGRLDSMEALLKELVNGHKKSC